jgi:CheY-like chemotaxis protein
LKEAARPPTTEKLVPGRRVAPLAVLLVDDNEDARVMLRTYLQLGGHRVHEASSGPEAVETALHVRPDVALVDLGLPGFDGFEVSRRLRQDVRTQQIVLIALTGYGQQEDRERSAQMGFAAHLVKPVTPERLDEVFALASRARVERERMTAS